MQQLRDEKYFLASTMQTYTPDAIVPGLGATAALLVARLAASAAGMAISSDYANDLHFWTPCRAEAVEVAAAANSMPSPDRCTRGPSTLRDAYSPRAGSF